MFLQVWEILHEHFSEILDTATPDIKNQSIRMIIDYIDQHYTEPLELEEIAKKAGWAKSTCCLSQEICRKAVVQPSQI